MSSPHEHNDVQLAEEEEGEGARGWPGGWVDRGEKGIVQIEDVDGRGKKKHARSRSLSFVLSSSSSSGGGDARSEADSGGGLLVHTHIHTHTAYEDGLNNMVHHHVCV